MRFLFLLALLATPATVLSTTIYQPAVHGPLPGHQILHVRHVDEQGRVTYIHDNKDHRPDFCTMPGQEELCRQQIEAANNAPSVYDNDTIILNTPHDPNELNSQHEPNELNPERDVAAADSIAPSTTPSQSSDVHSDDTKLTLDGGDVITIHNENGHIRNVNDRSINLNPAEGPSTEIGHIPNMNAHGLSLHQEKIQQDVLVDNVSHPRNVNDNGNSEGPAPEGGHPRNVNDQSGQTSHKEQVNQDPTGDNGSHPHNINDGEVGVPDGNVAHPRNIHDGNDNGLDDHPRNINDGKSIKEKLQSRPIHKLQQAINNQASS